jgi:dipeptidase E
MQIVAMGGGGFSMEPDNPLLDDYVLGLARSSGASSFGPRVCFVPTASGDSENYCLRFYDSFARRKCVPSHLPLFVRKPGDLRSFVLEQDVIYVGGGNTVNLLAIWRGHGLDEILREALGCGTVLCGISAGAICWFEAGVTDSFGPELAGINNGLGFLPGSVCPHYDGQASRRPAYQKLVAGGLPPGYGVDDGCAVHFGGGQVKRIVASRPGAQAYRVELVNGKLVETVQKADFLG